MVPGTFLEAAVQHRPPRLSGRIGVLWAGQWGELISKRAPTRLKDGRQPPARVLIAFINDTLMGA